MKHISSDDRRQKFLDLINAHLEEKYLHVRHYEGQFSDRMRIVFLVRQSEWGQVYVKGYDLFVKSGNKKYFEYIDKVIRRELSHLPIFKEDTELYLANERKEIAPILEYIDKDEHLRTLNSRRSRNFIIFKNDFMDLVYDSFDKKIMFVSSISFSSIEHDTNRKFTEEVCIDLLLDFKKSKERFIKMLSKPYDRSYAQAYKKYIDILNGDIDFSEEDIIVMISLLGRLNQERQMGPITVQRDFKLNPNEISKHKTLQRYIAACLLTIKEYTNVYLLNQNELSQIGNIGFDGKLNRSDITASNIPLLAFNGQKTNQIQIRDAKIIGNVFSPNYIESFFRKITELPDYAGLPILIDDLQDIIAELTNYARRFEGNSNPDFFILAKIKSILSYRKFGSLMQLVEKKIFEASSRRTYYKTVAEHLLSFKDEGLRKEEFYKLLSIYEDYISSEIKRFVISRKDNVKSELNNNPISISSDMHFNNMKDIANENYSKNFNIIAGDFLNNSYHRAGASITEVSDIAGIGVLGNHDVNWIEGIGDIKKEIKTNYKKSIVNLEKAFPKVKILNNEVIYKNGIAFVGLTIVTDESSPGRRSFFANEKLGELFSNENYLNIARKLLDSVATDTPIVVISHSPFKEYAVCKNKEIGIFSDSIFSNYPNVKVYVHGHGHSRSNNQIIGNVLCITNPIVRNIYTDSALSCDWETLAGKRENLIL